VFPTVAARQAAPGLRRCDVDGARPSTAEALRATQEASVDEHVRGVRVQRPAGAAAAATTVVRPGRGRHSDEAVVEGQAVSDGVLPATTDVRSTVVRERRRDRRVDLAQRTSVKYTQGDSDVISSYQLFSAIL